MEAVSYTAQWTAAARALETERPDRMFEDPFARPGADETERVADIALGLDVVQSRAGEQGHERRVDGGAIVATDEEPIFAPKDLSSQIQFADVVVCRQTTVIEEAAQGDALVTRVAKAGLNRRFVEHVRKLGVAPFEEAVDNGSSLVAPHALLLLSRRIRDGPLDSEDRTDVRECGLRAIGI